MKRYLITGGAGFIGTNFCERLLARGDSVTILDNLSRKGTDQNLKYLRSLRNKKLSFVNIDIRYVDNKLQKILNDVDIVYHLAGQVAVTQSIASPREDFEINALGTFNILEALRALSNKPIMIYASTNKVYGGMENVKIVENSKRFAYKKLPQGISEDQLIDFHSPYGCSKGSADQYVRDYSRIYGLHTVVLRQSCIYGTRQFGVEDQGWIAWFTIAAVLNRPIKIYGNGKQVRDALFVDDLFNAWDTVANLIDITSGNIYNVGGGTRFSLSLLELVRILERLLNKKLDVSYWDWRPGDQPVYISDIRKITKETGWKPTININDGVKKLSEWVSSNKNEIQKVLL